MKLDIVETVVIESTDGYEQHMLDVAEKVKQLNPEYYALDTDLHRLVWVTTIYIMERV